MCQEQEVRTTSCLDPGSTSQVKSDPPPRGPGSTNQSAGTPWSGDGGERITSCRRRHSRPAHAPTELHHAGSGYQCISLQLEASWLGRRGLADLRLWVRRGGSADQRAALVSAATVFILSRLVSHQILISSPQRIGSGSLAGQV